MHGAMNGVYAVSFRPGSPGTASRARAVENAVAIARMEGGEPSAFCLELLALYVSGKISGSEMRKRMLLKARSPAPEGCSTADRPPSAWR
jgi:hypothetical protein